MRPFVPLIANPHLATIASNFWPRHRELASVPVESIRHQVSPDVAILVHKQRPRQRPAGELVMVHGLEGSSDGGYMQSMAWAALQRGYIVHRMNIRGCGGTEGWCNTLYNAGLTTDIRHYLAHTPAEAPRTLVGYSLGGNQVLKLAGELGRAAADLVANVAAVSTPIDLAACVRALGRPGNFIYENRFVVRMKKRLAERRRLNPQAFGPIFQATDVAAIRTVFDFDDRITAPHFGFGDAPNYYATQSAQNFLDAIEVPTLLLAAQDDPLVPFAVYSHPAIARNPHLALLAPRHGGHVAFLHRQNPRFWADEAILDWVERRRNKADSRLVFT